MSDLRKSKPNARNWRGYLTAEEKREIASLDKAISKAEHDAALARLKRSKIQNRASVRAGNDR